MSEARTDMTEARLQGSSAQGTARLGKHRGPAASEDAQGPARGKHRRPATEYGS